MSDSLRPHGLQPTRLLRPWDFPGKSIVTAKLLFKDGPVRVLPALHTEAWPLTEPRMAEGSAPSSSAEADPES